MIRSFPSCFFLLLVCVFSFYQSDLLISASRATPEPPAGPREYLMDPPGIAYGAEEHGAESDLVLQEDEDGVQEKTEEEEEKSSFLQEVLSSLKTPLASCSLGMETEAVVLEIKEEERTSDGEDSEVEEEVKEEEDEPVSYQAAPAGSHLSDQTNEEEEDVDALSTSSPSRHDVEERENYVEENEEEQAEEEEEERVVGQFSHLGVSVFVFFVITLSYPKPFFPIWSNLSLSVHIRLFVLLHF